MQTKDNNAKTCSSLLPNLMYLIESAAKPHQTLDPVQETSEVGFIKNSLLCLGSW